MFKSVSLFKVSLHSNIFFLIRIPIVFYRFSDEVFLLNVYQTHLLSHFDANASFAFLVHGFTDSYPGGHSIQQTGSFVLKINITG